MQGRVRFENGHALISDGRWEAVAVRAPGRSGVPRAPGKCCASNHRPRTRSETHEQANDRILERLSEKRASRRVCSGGQRGTRPNRNGPTRPRSCGPAKPTRCSNGANGRWPRRNSRNCCSENGRHRALPDRLGFCPRFASARVQPRATRWLREAQRFSAPGTSGQAAGRGQAQSRRRRDRTGAHREEEAHARGRFGHGGAGAIGRRRRSAVGRRCSGWRPVRGGAVRAGNAGGAGEGEARQVEGSPAGRVACPGNRCSRRPERSSCPGSCFRWLVGDEARDGAWTVTDSACSPGCSARSRTTTRGCSLMASSRGRATIGRCCPWRRRQRPGDARPDRRVPAGGRLRPRSRPAGVARARRQQVGRGRADGRRASHPAR